MARITRQELSASLRQELDDVRNYIDGSNNALFGAHMDSRNNPHQVTKAQVGLGNVDNVQQASLTAFNSHVSNQSNPHGVTTAQIGAVPTSRTVGTGTGLSGGGALSSNRTLSLDLTYCDNRYLRRSGGTVTGTTTFEGFTHFTQNNGIHANSVTHTGSGWNHLYLRPREGAEVRVTRVGSTSVYEAIRALSFISSGGNVAYHKNESVRWGTGNPPNSGSTGDVYIQY